MSLNKKKPVQYFFVDINDPDYYKRIKVARACKDCRKRKSKCDIGKPGSGPCSSCQKHNKICEFTTTATTILPSASAQPYMKRKKIQQQQQDTPVSATVVSPKKTAGACQAGTEFYWSSHHLTLLSEGISYNENNDNLYPNTTNTTDASQFTVTQEDNHLVGHFLFNLPVGCEQDQQYQQQQEKCPVPLIPATPPLLLSSHSVALSSSSSSSSPTATPSPPLRTNYACDATFPWKASKSSYENSKKAIFMHSVSHVDPVKSNYQPSSYLLQQSSPSELDLLKIYFSHIHPSYPALSKNILKDRHDIPFCLRYAIMALSSLYYHQQPITPTSSSSISKLANGYYNKAWTIIQSRGTNDLVSAQTLLLLYKYHETIGEAKSSLLESIQTILGQHQQNVSCFGSGVDNGDDNEEWICRIYWIVYLHQYNATTTTWKNPPMIRLPCLLPSEQHDNEQEKTISQFLDSIHIACVYTSAMQNLALAADDESWSSNPP